MNTLQKTLSRKFLVSLAAIVGVLEMPGLDTTSKVIVAIVASVYVIAEAILDKGGQAKMVKEIEAAAHKVITSAQSSDTSKSSARDVRSFRETEIDVDVEDETPDTVSTPTRSST